MNRKLVTMFDLVMSAGFSSVTNAQTHTTTGTNDYQETRTLRDERAAIIPQIGAMTFVKGDGIQDSRQLMGLGLDFNMRGSNVDDTAKDYFAGISTGVF